MQLSCSFCDATFLVAVFIIISLSKGYAVLHFYFRELVARLGCCWEICFSLIRFVENAKFL